MPKPFIAVFLLIILTSACNRQVIISTLPAASSVTPISNTVNPIPIETATPSIVTATAESSCPAPSPRVEIGQQVIVAVENWDKLKLRSEPEISSGIVLMDLDQYSQLKILDGPLCVYSAETEYSYWFWKVVVIPSGEIGWVAEGDYSHYFIEKY